MLDSASSIAAIHPPTARGARFTSWLRTHANSVAMAGLLAFAGPITFFAGALSVMRSPTLVALVHMGLWWALYGVSLWGGLLVAGYHGERLAGRCGRQVAGAVWLSAACLAAVLPNLLTAPRAAILMEQGIVHTAPAMHLYGFTVSLVMALLYCAHLRRSRAHRQASARLAAAQRHARRRIAQSRVQEMQARIDPNLLFQMLQTVRRLYESDQALAEHFLDELIVFLRAALPRLRTGSSSLVRELELSRAFVRLHALAGRLDVEPTIDLAPDAMHARFPPGVLLPLLDSAVAGGPVCTLAAMRSDESTRVVLRVRAAPSKSSCDSVQSLLADIYGPSARLDIGSTTETVNVVVEVPYELA
jgi:hypothetical protein